MAPVAPVPDSTPGYRSEASKRRFTILAGVLGAVFFLAQFILPMVAMVLMMGSMALGRREFTIAEVDKAALWHGEVWLVAQTAKVDFRDVERSTSTFGLQRLRLNDLTEAGPTLPLDVAASESSPSLVPIGDRLWVIGTESVGYYERGTFSRLTGKGNPGGPSRPFPFGGQPAVLAARCVGRG